MIGGYRSVEGEALWKIMQFHRIWKRVELLTIIGTRLNKISWFLSVEQIIIHLRDADKSRYFAIGESNNCFIIQSPSLFFTQQQSKEGEKRGFIYAWAEY